MIDANEKEELLRLAKSSSLKDDMQYLSTHRHNRFFLTVRSAWIDYWIS